MHGKTTHEDKYYVAYIPNWYRDQRSTKIFFLDKRKNNQTNKIQYTKSKRIIRLKIKRKYEN